MKAVRVTSLDGPRALVVQDVPEPVPGDGEVLIDVHAAGVSFPDLLMTRGRYQRKPELPFSPGVEVAGTVRAAPPGTGLSSGDRVAAFVRVGGWAEVVAAPSEYTFRLPDAMSFRGGAGVVMNYMTAHLALARRARLRAGETVLVHGAAGGLGTASLQVAAALGARTIAVVSTADKAAFARAAGADEAVLAAGWLDGVRALTGERGVDVVADPVGGDRMLDSLRSLTREGRLLVLGFAEGRIPDIPANRLLLKNIDVIGVAWGHLVQEERGYPAEQWSDLLAYYEQGHLRPVDGAAFALDDAPAALARLDDRAATGKITLTVRP
ncbi:NADPH:quinone oxidoreductase family protein [Actinomadura vinacea]|uniref:NADPH:quinone oxidoreductase family protein n=1 Tax=Actinomadura vinacea TaxID=115336 RepID=A0ABP5VFJ9_9ACTN